MRQPDLLRYICAQLESAGVPHMLVGSLACMSYGEPRFTKDIDIVVDLKPVHIPTFLRWFPEAEYYVSADAVRDAVRARSQFNVLHPESGNKIDVMLARDDAWGLSQLNRRRRVHVLPDLEGYVAAPEDVILGKLLYYAEGGSDKHLRDIAGIVRVQGPGLDRGYVDQWARELGVEEPWAAVVAKESGSGGTT
jgi:hypothetical protein